VGLIGVAGLTAAVALAGSVSWGSPTALPGAAALNAGGDAAVSSISCPTAGNCSVAGRYIDGSGYYQALVADEVNGTWGNAIEAPGTEALNLGHGAGLESISCAGAGECVAGGDYSEVPGVLRSFLLEESNGAWGNAFEVPGLRALDPGATVADVQAISCASPGNCVAGGIYYDYFVYPGGYQPFVVDETNGTWGNAIEVPGIADLNTGASAFIRTISCSSPGNCTAGGFFTSNRRRPFVASEKNGVWSKAKIIPGTVTATGTLATFRHDAEIVSVSCTSGSSCTAGGTYYDNASRLQSFVVSSNALGVWGKAKILPGTPAASGTVGFAKLTSLSCATPAYCAAVGKFSKSGNHAFVAIRNNSVWGKAKVVPGIVALDGGGSSQADSVSCAGVGNCAATGVESAWPFVFVVGQTNGVWGTAVAPSGLANVVDADDPVTISCATTGECAYGGTYRDGSGWQAFVSQP
jgi:hypothetical protein